MNLIESESENDKQLVLKLKENDIKAFDTLYHRYSKKLLHFSFSLLKNKEDSNEIVQEVFFRIWKKKNDIDTSKSFKSYLFTISYNLIIDQLRLRLKEKEFRESLVSYFNSEALILTNEFDYNALNAQMKKAIDELPQKRKQIFVLSREIGLSHREIAAKLGITIKTVENQINLSLKHLKNQLGKDLIPGLLFISLFV